MSAIGTAFKAFVPFDAAVQATDTFNDRLGSKDSGLWRTVSGAAQAAVYGNLAYTAGDKALDSAKDVVTAAQGKHYGDAVVGIIPTTAYLAGATTMATFAAASVATAVNSDLADKRAARVA